MSKFLSDDDLWGILGCRPTGGEVPPSDWIESVKAAMTAFTGDNDKRIDFFCLVMICAEDFYKKYASHDDAGQLEGLSVERAESIFHSATVASGHSLRTRILMTAKDDHLLTVKSIHGRWHLDGDYCLLTFAGKERARDYAERHVRNTSNTNQQLQQQAQAAASEATAIGIGGKGGDTDSVASVTIKKDVAIEKDAIKQENNQTVNVNGDSAELVRELRGLLDDEHRRRGVSVVPLPGDAPMDDAPLPALDSRVSRADLAAKLGKGTDTLKGWEEKGQGPSGVFWPKAEVTANNAYYNFREVWQSFLSLLPNTDRIQQVALIEGLSITKRP